jgi:hypothetical protein
MENANIFLESGPKNSKRIVGRARGEPHAVRGNLRRLQRPRRPGDELA